MKANNKFNLPHFVIGLGVGALTGLLVALRLDENTRNRIYERTSKGFDSINEQARKLRESAGNIVEKGKKLVSRQPHSTGKEAETQAYEENKRDHLGG